MPKVICTLPNASDCISGVKFSLLPSGDGVISEEISQEAADLFASIPGYTLAAEDDGGAADRAAAEAAEKAEAEAKAAKKEDPPPPPNPPAPAVAKGRPKASVTPAPAPVTGEDDTAF